MLNWPTNTWISLSASGATAGNLEVGTGKSPLMMYKLKEFSLNKVLRETALQVQPTQGFVGKSKPHNCVGDTTSKLMYLTISREILSLVSSQIKLQLHGYDEFRISKNQKKNT